MNSNTNSSAIDHLASSAYQSYTDFFNTISDIDAASSTARVDATAQAVAAVHDLVDELASAILLHFPDQYSVTDMKVVGQQLLRANAAVAAMLETPEIINAYSLGEDISPQLAGAIGAVAGGILGAALAGVIAGAAAAAMPALAAGAIGVVAGVALGGSLALLLEGLAEGIFNQAPKDPLVIDLDGDGIELTSLERSSAFFDLDGDGFAERTAWVSPDDALLAIDRNANGEIDDISELFGSPDQEGFSELSELDTNSDGKIDALDATFTDLLIWQDLNGDGTSTPGELRSLSDVGITSIDLQATDVDETIAGNDVVKRSTVSFADGSNSDIGEVLFDLDQTEAAFNLPDGFVYDDDALVLPELRGFGEIADLSVAMSLDSVLKHDVEAAIDEARDGDFDQFFVEFEDVLIDWAGVEGVQWLADAQDVSVLFVFDQAYFETYDLESPGYLADDQPPPQIKGYLFNYHELDQTEVQTWLSEQSLVAPAIDGAGVFATGADQDYLLQTTVNGTSEIAETIEIIGVMRVQNLFGPGEFDPDAPTAPDMDAEHFAFLQKLMGQEYGSAENYITTEDVLVYEPTGNDLEVMKTSYDEVQDYYAARFLVQSAWTIISQEGETANLGALEPFKNLYVNPLNDTISGSTTDFVRDVINDFRLNNRGTDEEALELIATFKADIPHLGAVISAEYPDIDRYTIEEIFGTADITDGSGSSENLSPSGEMILLGHAGDDTLSVTSGSATIVGGVGNDVITGSQDQNTFVYRAGDGTDVITDFDYDRLGGSDVLAFVDLETNDVTFSNGGDNDVVITMTDGATVTLVDHLDRTRRWEIEEITFSDGGTMDQQAIRDRIVSDAKATGTIVGTQFKENYYHFDGDGSYTIHDHDRWWEGGNDRFEFVSLSSDNVTFVKGASDDLVMITQTGETITVIDQLERTKQSQIEEIRFADGVSLDVQGVRDKIVNDAKVTGTIVGTQFKENYLHSSGDGSYAITDHDYWREGGTDTLTFTDLSSSDVTFSRQSDDDLVLTTSAGEVITIIGHLQEFRRDQIEEISFSDGVVLDAQGIRDRIVADAKGSAIITGTELAENYVHVSGDGSYTITDYDQYRDGGLDTLTFTDVASVDVTFANGGSEDLVMTTGTNEVITVADYLQGSRHFEIEAISFSDGVSFSAQDIRNEIVADAKASGTVVGTQLAEHYLHTTGDGSYTIEDRDDWSDGGADSLTFTDVVSTDVTFANGGSDDLVISLSSGETITVINYLSGYRWDTWAIESISFSDGVVFDKAAVRDKILADGKNSGAIVGTQAGESYVHTAGEGSYTITDYDDWSNGGADSLTFTDIASTDVTFTNGDGDDLVITAGSGEAVTVINHLNKYQWEAWAIESISFSDGVTFDKAAVRDKLISDAKSSGTVVGTQSGENYFHASGDGSYTITDFDDWSNEGADSLTFTDLSSTDVVFSNAGDDDLLLSIAGGETIKIVNQFSGYQWDSWSIETIAFNDGTSLNKQGIRDKTVADAKSTGTVIGTEKAENYNHTAGDGSYSVTDFDAWSNGGADHFQFVDASSTDVALYKRGDDLELVTNAQETITIEEYFVASRDYAIEQISFDDGVSYSVSDLFGANIVNDEIFIA